MARRSHARFEPGLFAPSAGFTLIEALVVVSLIALLALTATPSLQTFAVNQSLSSSISDLLSSAMTARNSAITRNRPSVIEPMDLSVGWSSGWRIYVDSDSNGSYDARFDELIAETQALPPGIVIENSIANCSSKDRFVYRPDGFLKLDVSAGLSNGGIGMRALATGRERCMVINKVGRARVCGTGVAACSTD